MIRVFVLGRMGSDPEDGRDFKGSEVTTFSFAGQNFSKTEETTWFDCLVYGKTRDVIKNYTKKGSRLLVEGTLKTVAGPKGKKQFLSVNTVNMMDPKPETTKQEADDDGPF